MNRNFYPSSRIRSSGKLRRLNRTRGNLVGELCVPVVVFLACFLVSLNHIFDDNEQPRD